MNFHTLLLITFACLSFFSAPLMAEMESSNQPFDPGTTQPFDEGYRIPLESSEFNIPSANAEELLRRLESGCGTPTSEENREQVCAACDNDERVFWRAHFAALAALRQRQATSGCRAVNRYPNPGEPTSGCLLR